MKLITDDQYYQAKLATQHPDPIERAEWQAARRATTDKANAEWWARVAS